MPLFVSGCSESSGSFSKAIRCAVRKKRTTNDEFGRMWSRPVLTAWLQVYYCTSNIHVDCLTRKDHTECSMASYRLSWIAETCCWQVSSVCPHPCYQRNPDETGMLVITLSRYNKAAVRLQPTVSSAVRALM